MNRVARRAKQGLGVSRLALIIVLVAACASPTVRTNDVSGVSDLRLRDSAQYQLPEGLFVMPEAGGAPSVGSVDVTATYVSTLGPAFGLVAKPENLRTVEPAAQLDIGSALSYLEVARYAGRTALDPTVLDRLAHVAPPESQPELGAEVGALWTWSRARALLKEVGGPDMDTTSLPGRLQSLDLSRLRSHPYLCVRVMDIYTLVGMLAPTELTSFVSDLGSLPLPVPDTLVAALDAQAILWSAERRGTPVRLNAASATIIETHLSEPTLDDLSRAALIRLLLTSGHVLEAEPALADLRNRVDPQSGLLRSGEPRTGSVGATYLFSRLLDLRFAEIVTEATKDSLYRAANSDQEVLSTRLRAVAALKRAGDLRWRSFAPLADHVAAQFPARVSLSDLDGYLDLMEPTIDIHPDSERRSLADFDIGADDVSQRKAWAALRLAYTFANEENVYLMFPAFQRRLKAWLEAPDTGFSELMAAGSVIASTRALNVDSEFLNKTERRLRDRLGCRGATSFFSVDGSPSGDCSVVLTLQSRAVPGLAM